VLFISAGTLSPRSRSTFGCVDSVIGGITVFDQLFTVAVIFGVLLGFFAHALHFRFIQAR
jgi:hypothetical protein